MSKKPNKEKGFFSQAKEMASYLGDRSRIQKEILNIGIEGIFNRFKESNNRSFQILRYQRIIDPAKPHIPVQNDSFVKTDTFKMHCKFIREKCFPMSLSEALERLVHKEPFPDKTVIVTFDSGFLSTYLQATPLLLECNIPASFFVHTSMLDGNTLFPEDSISYACAYLHHNNHRIPYTDSLGQLLGLEPDKATNSVLVTPELADILIHAFKKMDESQQVYLLQGFNDLFLKDTDIPPPPPDLMTWKDVQHLESLGFEIGSMGHTYGNMYFRNEKTIDDDLKLSFDHLRENSITPLPCFAPPHGLISENIPDKLLKTAPVAILGLECNFTFSQNHHNRFIIPRKRILEGMSLSKDLFVASLWELEI
jgi:peptidoglycan/xylan/chitin deacetylase (PgdA/CDA1 family)